MAQTDKRRGRVKIIILLYPVALLGISAALNGLVFGINPAVIALPALETMVALIVAAALLIINHTWLMTTTELTRLHHHIYATPEEWEGSVTTREDVSETGKDELERRHNAHRNATENSLYFIFLAVILSLVSPPVMAAQIWIAGFAVARLGYTYCYLRGLDNARGVFMSLALTALYGMASYLLLSIV
ncbi:MAG: MAPEG family protein [Sneathiella sp.]